MIQLWTINRVLRWTGFRLVLDVWDGNGEREPARIGVRWYGLAGSDGWRRIEPANAPQTISEAYVQWLADFEDQ